MSITEQIERVVGVHPNTKCSSCRKTAKQAFYGSPVETGIDHPVYFQTRSFYQLSNNKHLCANCHREKEIKDLFNLMNKLDRKNNLIFQNK